MLYAGLQNRLVAFMCMTYASYELVADKTSWRFLPAIIFGNYFFHTSYLHRRNGHRALSHIAAYCKQYGHEVRDEVPVSSQRQAIAKAIFFVVGAAFPWIVGAPYLLKGLRSLWAEIKDGHLVFSQIHNSLLHNSLHSIEWGVVGLVVSLAATGLGYRHLEKVISSPKDIAGIPYVLYLRPFGIDVRLARREQRVLSALARGIFPTLGMSTDESRLALSLRWAGPVVGVGQPRETAPFHGATRIYLSGDNWKQSVRELMIGSRLTVLVLDRRKSMLWEFSEALRVLPPERLIVLVLFGELRYEIARTIIEKELRAQANCEHCIK